VVLILTHRESKDGKALACIHTFCLKCLQSTVSKLVDAVFSSSYHLGWSGFSLQKGWDTGHELLVIGKFVTVMINF
jgi:hypothetical protein